MIAIAGSIRRMNTNALVAFGVGLCVVVAGLLLLRSHAATPTAATEPEQGAVAGPATIVNDSAASGGKAVQFGSAATPPASGGCSSKDWAALTTNGCWPGAGNTGYPATQTFGKTYSSRLVITTDNTVIDGAKITGGVEINAKNVTIKNSWLTRYVGTGTAVNATGVINLDSGASATITNNLLDGQDGTHACIWDESGNRTLTATLPGNSAMPVALIARDNNCENVNDGIFGWAADGFDIENNYLHDFSTAPSNGHIDGFQTEGASDGYIYHNTFNTQANADSAVAIWDSVASSNNIRVDSNLISGGGFAIYAEDYDPSEVKPASGFSVTNISFTNNKFSTIYSGCVGYYGVWYPRGAPTDQWNRSGNTVLETGVNIDNGNPTYKGNVCD